MLDVSADLAMRYATKIGADFKIVRQEHHGGPLLRPHAVKLHTALELAIYASATWCDAHRAFEDRPFYDHGYFNPGAMVTRDPASLRLANAEDRDVRAEGMRNLRGKLGW